MSPSGEYTLEIPEHHDTPLRPPPFPVEADDDPTLRNVDAPNWPAGEDHAQSGV